jgi:hypothetical protein
LHVQGEITMTLFEAYDAILALGASRERALRVAEMRREFERRTGEFSPEDPWFEARSRAFWDDAVTTQRFAEEVAQALPEAARAWVPRLGKAHRGLFVAVPGAAGEAPILRDLWGGAELVVHLLDAATKDAVRAAAAPFDARLVGTDDPPRVGMLPGAVFHAADAAQAIAAVVDRAKAEKRSGHDVLDALLRMERGYRASARVKAAYAYRADRLGPRGA